MDTSSGLRGSRVLTIRRRVTGPGRELNAALRSNLLDRWLIFVLGGSIIGAGVGAALAVTAVAFVLFSAIIGAALANPMILLSIRFFQTRTNAAAIVIRWYRSQSDTDADHAIDAGDTRRAEELLLGMDDGSPWASFQNRRIRAMLAEGQRGNGSIVDALKAAEVAMVGHDRDRAAAVVAVFRAEQLVAAHGDWIGMLAPHGPVVASECPPLPKPKPASVLRFLSLEAAVGTAISTALALLALLIGYRPS